MGDIDPKDPATQLAALQIMLQAVSDGDWATVDKLCELFCKQA